MKVKKIILKLIKYILFFMPFFILFVSLFINKKFGNMDFGQLLYNIIYTEGANYSIVVEGVFFVIILFAILLSIFFAVKYLFKKLKIKNYFNIYLEKNIKRISIFNKIKINYVLYFLIVFISCISASYKILNIDEYIKSQKQISTFFEDYYVLGTDIKIEFPNKKRNLIYIYSESLESTNVSKFNGGIMKKSYIPKLEQLALENINFSNNDKIGGAIQLKNTSWTIAGLVAHTAGIPLKLSIGGNLYSKNGKFLPGVYNLGDILHDNGYNNYFIIGSDATYGGRKDYFKSHGNYTIYDYYYAKEKKLIDKDYKVFWGYEDKKLFEFAKNKILEASKSNKPFNFTLLTVDTHFTDGYMDDTCEEVFDKKYANAFYCSDSKIYNFVSWLKKQEFYDNTTIIISGDHLTMQRNFYNNIDNYERTIFNTFINSAIRPVNEKNRLFSSLDMFPTTLASLGVKIEGNKLGLGVNLFSNEKTLLEEYGISYVNSELLKKSSYYNDVILGYPYEK